MISKPDRNKLRLRRHLRIRKTVFGTAERPRLSVYRSNKHIYAQVVDDINQVTLASASTLSPELKELRTQGGTVEAAKKVGQLIAQHAANKGVKTVVFDRGGYPYHGRIEALAQAAREAGLEF